MLFSKILVAYDGSIQGKEALNKAIEIAKQNEQIGIEVVYVVSNSTLAMAYEYPQLIDSAINQGHEIVKGTEEALSRIPNPWRTVVLQGQPAGMILSHAKQHDCDLIVIGSRGHSGLKELFLGSVSHNVVQHSPVPVFVIK